MNPLSLKRRRIYLGFFSVIFIVTIPLLILYATGYRLSSALNIIRTGGLHISVPYSGAQVHIGDEIIKETSVFQKNIFIQNLRPGSYEVKVTKDGMQTWSKRLIVFPQTVTEGFSFLISKQPIIEEVSEFLVDKNSEPSTTTKSVPKKLIKNSTYSEAILLFSTSTNKTATSTEFLKTKRKLSVENINGVLHVIWQGDQDSTPYYFCINQICKKEVVIKTGSKVKSFDFFPGRDDLLVVALSGGIFVVDIDDRSGHNIQYLMEASNLDFRIKDGETIYIKDGKKLYRVIF